MRVTLYKELHKQPGNLHGGCEAEAEADRLVFQAHLLVVTKWGNHAGAVE